VTSTRSNLERWRWYRSLSGRSQLSATRGCSENISVLEHLEEFRKRIVRALLAIAVGALVGFVLIDRIVAFVLGPTRRALPVGATLIYTQPGEAFGLYIQIALIAGVVFAMPFIMSQLWRLTGP
jgi:sec-independent protein translocase protein TatC